MAFFARLSLFVGALLLAGAALAERQREGTEWMTSYWYNASDSKLPRILLVGDSICNGYQTLVRDELAGAAYVSFYATSKCASDPTYLKALAFMLEEYDYKAIHFNNGLHSLSSNRAEWKAGLEAALKLIQEKGKGAKIIWASSTPLKDPALTEKAKELNAIAAGVVKDMGIPTDDLFSLMDPLERGKYWTDTYHFTEEARRMQAKQVANCVREALGAKKASAEDAKASLAAAASETGPDGKISTKPQPAALKNGDFESDGAWSLYPANPEKGDFAKDSNNPNSGLSSAKIVVKSPGLQFYQHAPALEPGVSYVFKFWARSEASGKIRVHLRTQKPPYQFYGDKTVDVGDAWKEFSVSFSLPEDFKAADHTLLFNFLSEGVYWIDDASFERK